MFLCRPVREDLPDVPEQETGESEDDVQAGDAEPHLRRELHLPSAPHQNGRHPTHSHRHGQRPVQVERKNRYLSDSI